MRLGSIKVTGRGLALAYVALTLALLSLLARDPLLLLAAAPPALVLAFDIASLVFMARGVCRVDMDRSELRLHLGDRVRVEGKVICGGAVEVVSSGLLKVKGLKPTSPPEVVVEVEGLHIGSYEVEGLEVIRVTPVATFSFKSRASTRLAVRVTPRAASLLALAYEVLAGGGLSPGVSELESMVGGDSGLYAYTREYVPGDSLRRVDWKATARRLRFMVKEYRLELGGLGLLALDMRCFGEHTCDDLASAALLIAMSSFNAGGYVRVLEVDSGRLIEVSPGELLAYTISRVLEPEIAGKLDLHAYTPPLTIRELERIASKLGHGRLVRRAMQTDSGGATVILTTLLVDSQKILDTAEKAGGSEHPTIIVTPRKPWLDMGDVEEAYIAYTTYSKLVAKIRSMGAKIYTCCPLAPLN